MRFDQALQATKQDIYTPTFIFFCFQLIPTHRTITIATPDSNHEEYIVHHPARYRQRSIHCRRADEHQPAGEPRVVSVPSPLKALHC
jgi:hypothetical protein